MIQNESCFGCDNALAEPAERRNMAVGSIKPIPGLGSVSRSQYLDKAADIRNSNTKYGDQMRQSPGMHT